MFPNLYTYTNQNQIQTMNKEMSNAEKFMRSIHLDETDMLIANFMECEFHDDGRLCYSTGVDDYVTEDPMWDTSWDWIMPVVQECKCVKDADYVLIDAIDFSLCNNDLLGVYEAVVKFIKAQKL
tara:strand:+ start:999 stop:1370 length:372 start_codon:yes stop_codon:yes gene_type:complete